jgi:hypothetical protein
MSDKVRERERLVLIATSGLTVLSGAAQALAPPQTLDRLRAEDDRTTRHLFRTICTFMVVVGGTLLDVLLRRLDDRSAVLWAVAQKAGASGTVGLGVRRGVFSPLALVVAGFDALSGLLALDYWRRLGCH